ncbi:MAG TPA: hypothetical protein VK063_07405 [Beutenbergiaceae bacterium]|nr:hypothetical protein [Beutenbergiaceae bacterium]
MRLVLAHSTILGVPLSSAGAGSLLQFVTSTEVGGVLAWSVMLTVLAAVLAGVLAVVVATPGGST